jgi:HAD superfamily hydrolase (TIGR01549 family)
MTRQQLVFFDIGQTLIDEWDFINHFDIIFLEILNGFGARIEMRDYRTLRDDIIRNRRLGHGSVMELAIEICRLICMPGYDAIIAKKLEPLLADARKKHFHFFQDAKKVLDRITNYCRVGIIANQSHDVLEIMAQEQMERFFDVVVLSCDCGLRKPDLGIFRLALQKAGGLPAYECIMVGDRLDTDIYPARRLGMKTVRTTNSLFALQRPQNIYEQPDFTVKSIVDVPPIIERIINSK